MNKTEETTSDWKETDRQTERERERKKKERERIERDRQKVRRREKEVERVRERDSPGCAFQQALITGASVILKGVFVCRRRLYY